MAVLNQFNLKLIIETKKVMKIKFTDGGAHQRKAAIQCISKVQAIDTEASQGMTGVLPSHQRSKFWGAHEEVKVIDNVRLTKRCKLE